MAPIVVNGWASPARPVPSHARSDLVESRSMRRTIAKIRPELLNECLIGIAEGIRSMSPPHPLLTCGHIGDAMRRIGRQVDHSVHFQRASRANLL